MCALALKSGGGGKTLSSCSTEVIPTWGGVEVFWLGFRLIISETRAFIVAAARAGKAPVPSGPMMSIVPPLPASTAAAASRSRLTRILLLTLVFSPLTEVRSAETVWPNGAIATSHPLATDAALHAVRLGGNAVDATVAAALTLGIVDAHNSGIGGGCFMLIRTARGSIEALDGRETAPAQATRDMFVRDGKAVPELSQTGALAPGIPGSLAVYDYALRHFGRLKLHVLLEHAAQIAEDGFPLDQAFAGRLRETAGDLARFPESKKIFLQPEHPGHPDHSPPAAGSLLRQPDLARSYRQIAAEGIGWFYGGDFAVRTAAWMQAHGGLITRQDFENYQIRLREPVRSRYRDCEIVGFPPPSSGGIHVAQILNILSHFEVSQHPPDAPETIHLLVEAMRFAFADRAHWLGDPAFTKVPLGLVNKGYARSLAELIHRDQRASIPSHGPADQFSTGHFGRHTTHLSAADAEGNWVACTTSLNTSFGSKVVIPGTGILLNNQMDDFAAQPGTANFFGLAGAEANSIAPGKRPLSSMSPTIILRGGRPIFALGAAGGPTIISQTVVNIVNLLDFQLPVAEALATARIHHQWRPDQLFVEKPAPALRAGLEKLGHQVVPSAGGAAQIVGRAGSGFSAAHDPRLRGKADGW